MPDPNWVREYQDGEIVPGTSYCVIRLIGAGGMGSVYEVEHIELGRRYVLKSLLSTLTTRQDLSARMRNEWRALGQIQHPNIVDIINAGTTTNGVPYYVMELLSGETVRERLEREGRLPTVEAVRIARSVLCGLQAAHSIGVIHRDVKPANVFLERNGGIKLLDFGIAKVHIEGAPKITIKGLAVGTPRYMSPEQAAGEKADSRSDVYAVALLLFEMLTGDGPFRDAQDHAEQMDAHLHQIPPLVSTLVDVSEDLAFVVARALEKNPDSRPQTASELMDALAAFAPESDAPMPNWPVHGRSSVAPPAWGDGATAGAPSSGRSYGPPSSGRGADAAVGSGAAAGDVHHTAGEVQGAGGAPPASTRSGGLAAAGGPLAASGAVPSDASASVETLSLPGAGSVPRSSVAPPRASNAPPRQGATSARASVAPARPSSPPARPSSSYRASSSGRPAGLSDESVFTTGTIVAAILIAAVLIGAVLSWARRLDAIAARSMTDSLATGVPLAPPPAATLPPPAPR